MGSAFGAFWEDPEGGFIKFMVKSFKTRPNTPYGGETSCYSLLQGGVWALQYDQLLLNLSVIAVTKEENLIML